MRLLSPKQFQTHPGKFIALWADLTHVHALYQPGDWVSAPLAGNTYPALPAPGAAWFQRLAQDTLGCTALGTTDTRPAIEQWRAQDGTAAWPEFAKPEEGQHALALGPVHGAITEPGYFRFTLRGERVHRLETRLGYAHKSTLGLIRGKSPRLAARFAARISGDATVAHSLAFAHAAESALGLPVPARAVHLRAIMAELERLANHAGDLAAIARIIGSALPESRLALAREHLCKAAHAAFGHRLMMDIVIPGGIAGDLRSGGMAALHATLIALEHELPGLTHMFEDVQDHLATGTIPPALAAAFCAGGFTGRASGQPEDSRVTPGYAPYTDLNLHIPLAHTGDVAARTRIRLAEMSDSIRLLHSLLAGLPDTAIAIAPPSGTGAGLGVAESFRGPVWHWLRIESGAIADVFIADPSTLHFPLLEHAATTGNLADFPLILQSINPSHSGVDL